MLRSVVRGTLAAAVAVSVSCRPTDQEPTPRRVNTSSELLHQAVESRVAHLDAIFARPMRSFYLARNYELVWVHENGLTPEGKAFLQFLLAEKRAPSMHVLERHLLEIERFASNAWENPPAASELVFERLAELDVAISRAAFRYADHVTGGELRPASVNEQWFIQDVKPDLSNFMLEAVEQARIGDALLALAERHAGYAGLRDALIRYRELGEMGGWPRVSPAASKLERGARGPSVVSLKRRLATTGDFEGASPELGSEFDATLESAVKKFQKRHGLKPDGVVGESTLHALNVPLEQRMRQLELNLERRRWMPERFGNEYVLVNIPAFQLWAYRDGELALTMRVVVGKPMHSTPIFADEIEIVAFAPYWNVPPTIAADEILPKVGSDGEYLERNNYEILTADGSPAPLDDLTRAAVRRGLLRVRQRPGPANALGRVKFLFPNSHHVYLHDTPADHLFASSRRAFSHGCVRLEEPARFAAYVLDGTWSIEEIAEAMHGPDELAVPLPRQIPVYITYQTAWVDDDDNVQFRRDVYDLDERLARELEERKRRDSKWRPALAKSMGRFLDGSPLVYIPEM